MTPSLDNPRGDDAPRLPPARGLPALLYRGAIDSRHVVIAGLMQATSLLGLIDAAGSAALIGAGLLSVLMFPLIGLVLLRGVTARPVLRTESAATT